MNVGTLEGLRDEILNEMRAIRAMRPGTVSEQFLTGKRKGSKDTIRRGPYYLWQYYDGGKPVRERLTSDDEIRRAREEVNNYKRFIRLCKEFEELTGKLGALEREQAASDGAKKRGLKSRPRNRRRSRG
ncbi:MAG: hypothetical protein FJY92_06100 [Candidatus Hydrogenedentes bacterium]|nr:hypothetical protein [Candidatus Hydrogenedentota bacterium]